LTSTTTLLIFLFASISVTLVVPSDSFANMTNTIEPDKANQGEIGKAVTQVNNCGNGKDLDLYWTPTRGIVEGKTGEPVDVYCQNLASQIKGNYNTAALAGQQNQPNE
jgi:hypothetical protein